MKTKEDLINILLETRGKIILRKNEHDRWVETYLNDTYIELALEFPEDYVILHDIKRETT